jgi:hypothetical protein
MRLFLVPDKILARSYFIMKAGKYVQACAGKQKKEDFAKMAHIPRN